MSNLSVILCNPQHPGNVGAISRAMANFGYAQLVLVRPPDGWRENDELKMLANGYVQALDNAIVIESLAELVESYSGLIGFTRRSGSRRPILGNLDDAADHLSGVENIRQMGLVFGNERTGLTQAEIECCDSLYTIETTQDSGSLNLSLAASLVMYELAKARRSLSVFANDLSNQPATLAIGEEVMKGVQSILSCWQEAGLHDPIRHKRSNAAERLRRILMRSRMSTDELNWLQRNFERLRPLINKKPNSTH